VTDPDNVSQIYAVRHPGGIVMDPSPLRLVTEERLARYRETVPGYELVTCVTLSGEWVVADQTPMLPAVPPRRGDAVEAWLKAQRDEYSRDHDTQWDVIDGLLDEYRLHADTGTPLDQHACEAGNGDDCHGCHQEAQK
jgi:hypothetical protein